MRTYCKWCAYGCTDCRVLVLHRNNELDFDAMDGFMWHVLGALREHGKRAVSVFPPAANVLLSFSERLANEVVRVFRDYMMFCSLLE